MLSKPSCPKFSSGVLARHNAHANRAISSRVDLDVYCPSELLCQPGPLFADTETIEADLQEFISERVVGNRIECKCFICGFPDCECTVCGLQWKQKGTSTKTKAKVSHQCPLQYTALGAPNKAGRYDVELLAQLKEAWAKKGVSEVPSFSAKGPQGAGYYWPEEQA